MFRPQLLYSSGRGLALAGTMAGCCTTCSFRGGLTLDAIKAWITIFPNVISALEINTVKLQQHHWLVVALGAFSAIEYYGL